jgi:outer membrane protein
MIITFLCILWSTPPTPNKFSALTLQEALKLAETHHQAFALAQQNIQEAQAARRLAAAELLPDITVSGTYARQPERGVQLGGGVVRVIQNPHLAQSRASVNMSVFDVKHYLVLHRAQDAYLTVALQAQHDMQTTRYNTARAFLAVLSARELQQAAQQREALALVAKNEAQSRVKLGLAGNNDLTRAELEWATAQWAVTDSAFLVEQMQLQLERFIGQAAHGLLASPTHLLEHHPPQEENMILEEAHSRRLDLESLAHAAQAARKAQHTPLWGLVPRLSLNGAYDLTSQTGFTGRHDNWMVSLTAQWTLFNKGREYFETQQNIAQARKAALLHQQRQEDVSIEVRQNLAQWQRAHTVLKQMHNRLALAQQNTQEVTLRYREGLVGLFELTSAHTEEFNARTESARALFDAGTAFLALRQSQGLDILN